MQMSTVAPHRGSPNREEQLTTVIRETSSQEGDHWSYGQPCVSGRGSQCRRDAVQFGPACIHCFSACGKDGYEWEATTVAPARHWKDRAHETCNRMYPAHDREPTVSGLFTPEHLATGGCLASKMLVRCCLLGEEEAHAVQPVWGEKRPLAKAGRQAYERIRSSLADLACATERARTASVGTCVLQEPYTADSPRAGLSAELLLVFLFPVNSFLHKHSRCSR